VIRPAGFDPVDGGWGRPVEGHWNRPLPHGIWQHLSHSNSDGRWQAGVSLDAPWTVLGRPVPPWERRHARYLAPNEFPDQTGAVRWLGEHRTPHAVAESLTSGAFQSSPELGGGDRSAEFLDAVAVLIVGGHLAAARSLLAFCSGLTASATDRAAQLAAVAGALRLPLDVLAPADTADVLALLTRAISADLALARAHRWARLWLPTARCDRLTFALAEVAATPSPPDEHAAVAQWQRHLERVRTAVADPFDGSWPTALPGVAENLRTPPRAAGPPSPPQLAETDRYFATHAGHCPHGRPGDGRARVDVFFDYSAFPVWTAGGGCMTGPHQLGLPPDLAADLWSWASSHDRRAVPGGQSRPADTVARHEQPRLQLLAGRLERSTGLAAVVNHPRGLGDSTCPTPRCLGPRPLDVGRERTGGVW
jgi:hypothetical protein